MKKYFLFVFLFVFNTFSIVYANNNEIIFGGSQKNSENSNINDSINDINNVSDNLNNNNNINNIKDIFSSMVSIKALKTEKSIQLQNEKVFSYKENNFIFSTGTGFFIDALGTILTNYHIIENSDKIIATTEDEVEYICDIVGYDILSDITILKIKTDKKFKFIELNEDIKYDIGDNVFVIGNPYNLGMSMSKGIISAINRKLRNNNYLYTNLIQTDAAINKGNSGGALFKENGEFIGMTSVIFSPNGNNIGIGFAIPTKNIIDIVEKINNFGYVQRGWIGIKSTEIIDGNLLKVLNLKKNKAIIITDIEKNSPADTYGLKISDIIISYNNEQIDNFDQLNQLILNTSINSKVNFVIYRNGSLKTINVLVKEHPQEQENFEYKKYLKNNTITLFNSKIIPINNLLRKKFGLNNDIYGLYILEVGENLKKYGIETGNIILSINQNIMDTEFNINKTLQNIKDNSNYIVIINQNGKNNLFFLNNR